MANPRFLLLFAFAVLPSAVSAQLGHSEESTDRQLRSLNFPKSESHSARGFRYKELSSDRAIVKQYVNPTTKMVFGMTWNGTQAPSLVDFLGFDPLKITGPGVRHSLHTTVIQTDTLNIAIVSVVGHFVVTAVRTDLLPKGVEASVVKP